MFVSTRSSFRAIRTTTKAHNFGRALQSPCSGHVSSFGLMQPGAFAKLPPMNQSRSYAAEAQELAESAVEPSVAHTKVQFPLSLVGSVSKGRKWWWAWDPNVSFVRDILNPSVFLTFKDAKGNHLERVRYEAYLLSWGMKVECTVRLQFGMLLPSKTPRVLNALPDRVKVDGGWDMNFYFFNVGWADVKELDAKLLFVGLGGGVGATKLDGEQSYLELNKFEEVKLTRAEKSAADFQIL